MWISFRVQKRILSILTMEKCLLARKVIQFYVYCTHPEAQVKLLSFKTRNLLPNVEINTKIIKELKTIRGNHLVCSYTEYTIPWQHIYGPFLSSGCRGKSPFSVDFSRYWDQVPPKEFYSTLKHLVRPTSLSQLLILFIYSNWLKVK